MKIINTALSVDSTVEVRSAGFGTPKWAMIIMSGGVTDSSINPHGRLGVGFIDDTTQGSFSIVVQDAVATSNANRTIDSNVISGASAPGDQLLAIQITGALVEDGIDLTIVDAPAAAYLITVIMGEGTGWEQTEVIIHDDLGNTIGDQEVTLSKTWAAPPNLLLGITMGGSAIAPEAEQQGIFSIGVSDFSTHRGVMIGVTDAITGSPCSGLVSEDNMLGQVLAGLTQWQGYPHTPTTSNFQFATDTATGTDIAIFLVLRHSKSYASSIQTLTVPTAGTLTVDTGISPIFNMSVLLEGVSALGTREDTFDAALSISTYDGSTTSAISMTASDTIGKSVAADSYIGIINTAGDGASISGNPSFFNKKMPWALFTNPSTPVLGFSLTLGVSQNRKYKYMTWGAPRRFARGRR